MMKYWRILAIMLALAAAAAAQAPGGGDCAPMEPHMRAGMMRGPGMGMRPGMGKWWNNPAMAQRLALTEAQVQQMEKAFQEHRARLFELRNNLNGLEAGLEPLIAANRLNEAQITTQIEKIAQARAALEKLNSMMLLDMRRALTAEQWKQLQQQRIGPRSMVPPPAVPPPPPQ